ncbi:MAG: hypothetical protein AAF092_02180 [Pseudomonadota bacterium]
MICRYVFASLMCFCLALAGHAGISDVSCDDRTRLTATLTGALGAERQGVGLRDPETMLEVWVTPASGDWLLVQHYASGTSCIVAMGEHWQRITPNPA